MPLANAMYLRNILQLLRPERLYPIPIFSAFLLGLSLYQRFGSTHFNLIDNIMQSVKYDWPSLPWDTLHFFNNFFFFLMQY